MLCIAEKIGGPTCVAGGTKARALHQKVGILNGGLMDAQRQTFRQQKRRLSNSHLHHNSHGGNASSLKSTCTATVREGHASKKQQSGTEGNTRFGRLA